jgi:hypothetical protein
MVRMWLLPACRTGAMRTRLFLSYGLANLRYQREIWWTRFHQDKKGERRRRRMTVVWRLGGVGCARPAEVPRAWTRRWQDVTNRRPESGAMTVT